MCHYYVTARSLDSITIGSLVHVKGKIYVGADVNGKEVTAITAYNVST